MENRRELGYDQRKQERRAPKRGVNIRHDDEGYLPARVKRPVDWCARCGHGKDPILICEPCQAFLAKYAAAVFHKQ